VTLRSTFIGAAVLATCAAGASAQLVVGSFQFHPNHASATAATSYTMSAHTGLGAALDSLSSPWSSGGFSGTVNSWVYDNSGGRTFVYRFDVDGGSTHSLGRATLDGAWNLFLISSAGADSTGSGPVNGNPAWLQHGVGGIGIQFTDILLPGATGINAGADSALVWFHTNATAWQIGNAAAIGSGAAANSFALVPIPAPSVAVAGLLGLGLLASRRRR
jgi:hypothetical protein